MSAADGDAMRQPRVGVGVIVVRDGLVLLGERLGTHGAGTWALPGGHLEFGESVDSCARRELFEETGLVATQIVPGPYTNDVMPEVGRHYLTVFVRAAVEAGEPLLKEPARCAGWHWFAWSALPPALFQPLRTLVQSGYVPAGTGRDNGGPGTRRT